jgi:hypothetical protein
MLLLRSLLLCAALAVSTGCAGYKLGPTNALASGEKTIRFTPFSNQTLQPRLGDAVTAALRRNVQSDGTFKLATGGSADILVTGVLTHYERRELSLLPNDVLTASDFRINVKAQVTARERGSGRTIFEREVSGYTLVRVGSDLASAERQALPILADNLARNITAILVDGSW